MGYGPGNDDDNGTDGEFEEPSLFDCVVVRTPPAPAPMIHITGDIRACRESLCEFQETMPCGPMTVDEFDRAIAEAYRAGAEAALAAVEATRVLCYPSPGSPVTVHFPTVAREKLGLA